MTTRVDPMTRAGFRARIRRVLSPHQHGFSLIELMFALAVFATAFLMMLGIFPASSSALHQSRSYTLATHVGEQVIEQHVTAQTFANVVNRTSGTNDPITGQPNSPITLVTTVNGSQQVLTFNWQIVVTPVTSDLKSARCQIWWIDFTQAGGPTVVRTNVMEVLVPNI